jgi:phosphopantothenoylcysteine synthetase/decarboxylase
MKILICVTGGIAAYKMLSVVSKLVDNGHYVRIAMTEHAKLLASPLSFSALSHTPIIDDINEWERNGDIKHIESPQNSDVMIVAPATANIIAKLALGIADDIVSTMYLAFPESRPVIICPAMNTVMWEKSQAQNNVNTLKQRKNHYIIDPVIGKLACGTTGIGKLAPTKTILDKISTITTI